MLTERGIENNYPSELPPQSQGTLDLGDEPHNELEVKINAHAALTNNPHGVTKVQVGLGNVDNTSDANKPISDATATALAGKAATGDIATAIGAHDISGTAHADIRALVGSSVSIHTWTPTDDVGSRYLNPAELPSHAKGDIIRVPAITTEEVFSITTGGTPSGLIIDGVNIFATGATLSNPMYNASLSSPHTAYLLFYAVDVNNLVGLTSPAYT